MTGFQTGAITLCIKSAELVQPFRDAMKAASPALVPVLGTTYTFFVQRIQTDENLYPAYRVELTQMIEV